LPNLYSSSLEYFNVSSNHLQTLDDYFVSNLHSIRSIDFDSNKYLRTISLRAFCFLNLDTFDKLSFRYNNLPVIDAFEELFCRLFANNISRTLLDINYNINLQCTCMLVRFEDYLLNYRDLTCIQQGQDRYFISKLAATFNNCTQRTCHNDLCQSSYVQHGQVSNDTCYEHVIDNDNISSTHHRSDTRLTTVLPLNNATSADIVLSMTNESTSNGNDEHDIVTVRFIPMIFLSMLYIVRSV
jgi:hypothetical protein